MVLFCSDVVGDPCSAKARFSDGRHWIDLQAATVVHQSVRCEIMRSARCKRCGQASPCQSLETAGYAKMARNEEKNGARRGRLETELETRQRRRCPVTSGMVCRRIRGRDIAGRLVPSEGGRQTVKRCTRNQGNRVKTAGKRKQRLFSDRSVLLCTILPAPHVHGSCGIHRAGRLAAAVGLSLCSTLVHMRVRSLENYTRVRGSDWVKVACYAGTMYRKPPEPLHTVSSTICPAAGRRPSRQATWSICSKWRPRPSHHRTGGVVVDAQIERPTQDE